MIRILLLASIVVPAFVSVLLFSGLIDKDELAKQLAFLGLGFPCLAGIVLFIKFDGATEDIALSFSMRKWGSRNLVSLFTLDLTGCLPALCHGGSGRLCSWLGAIESGAERIKLYLALLCFMQSGLMGLFASVDLFFYYLFHEFALIPTFIMIGIWGGRDRRSVALEITIYLTLGALISLGGLVALNVMIDAENSISHAFESFTRERTP